MDAFSSLVCLGIGVALPVSLIGFPLRRGMRQLQVAEAYGDVARQYGLDVDTRGVSLQGHLSEQRLWVGEVMVGHGPQRKMVCWGVLDFERPLGLGLMLRRRGLADRLRRRPRGPAVALSDPALDRQVDLHGDDPERVRALLDSDLVSVLGGTLSRWRDLVITDQSIRVYLKQPLGRADQLAELVEAMRTLAASVLRARQHVPPPPIPAACASGFRHLAERIGVDFEDVYPGIGGEVDGRRVRVTPVRRSEGYVAELRVGFREHRRTGLRLRPQVEPDGYWSVGQDIQTGDPAFDRAFVVKGYDPEAVRDQLTPAARQGLLALEHVGRLDVDDLRLHVADLPLDPVRIEPVLVQALRTAEDLGW